MAARSVLLRSAPLVALALTTGLLREAASEPRVVTQAFADLDGDGRTDAIAVRMVSGRRYVDETPWCGMSFGGTPKYEGRFVLSVTLAGRGPVDTDLNALFGESGAMWFYDDAWPIVFRDLNSDGRPEFSLGQYGSCNGWVYRILGVEGTGRVTVLSGDIFSGDRAASSASFHPTTRGFRHTWYDNSRGSVFCAEFAWVEKARRFWQESETARACPEDQRPVER